MKVENWLFDQIMMMISSKFSEFYFDKANITPNTLFDGVKSGNIVLVHREQPQWTALMKVVNSSNRSTHKNLNFQIHILKWDQFILRIYYCVRFSLQQKKIWLSS